MIFFFFKQKTAYEMRISDWSSDVCSSDLLRQSFEDAKASTGAEEIESAFDEARRDARSIGAEPDSGSRTVDAGTAPQLRDAPVAAPESYEHIAQRNRIPGDSVTPPPPAATTPDPPAAPPREPTSVEPDGNPTPRRAGSSAMARGPPAPAADPP